MKLLTRILFLALAIPSLAFAADTGDYDGGGGGTLPADPVSTKQVAQFIRKEAKLNLRLYLKYSLWSNQSSHFKIPSKLFDGPRTIYDVMENTDIEVRMDRPCYDNRGMETDASIYADTPNTICFSAARVAPKLPEELMRKEVLALLLHEFSHLLGTTEKEAREYQAESAAYLKQANRDTAPRYIDSLQLQARQTEFSYNFLQANFDTMDALKLRDAFEQLNKDFDTIHFVDVNTAMAIYSADDSGYITLESGKVMLANWYVMGESNTGDYKYWKDQYEKAFGDKQEITLSELHEKIYGHKVDFHGDEKISRINSKADLKAFVEDFGKFLDDSREYLEQLEHSLALRPIPGKPQAVNNPWLKFKGFYSVVKKECNDGAKPSDYTEIDVINESVGSTNLALQIHTPNSWGNEGLYDGAGDTLGGAAVHIEGDANSASRFTSFGDRWGERWINKSWKLERAGEDFLATQILGGRQHGENYGSVCHYTLRKMPSVN